MKKIAGVTEARHLQVSDIDTAASCQHGLRKQIALVLVLYVRLFETLRICSLAASSTWVVHACVGHLT